MYYYANVSCANLYRKATFRSEIDSQVVLWEKLISLETENDFIRVKTEDGYEGWVNRHQVEALEERNIERSLLVSQNIAGVFEKPSEYSTQIRDVVSGCRLPFIEETASWLQIPFPDGHSGWLEKKACSTLGRPGRESLVEQAGKFLGVPYLWGGKTAKGIDCSGFTQLLHKLFGINIRRDAWMQFEDARFVSDDPLAGQAGDLMFFAENGERITHVGICLGGGKLIHARGMVRVNSLDPAMPGFSERLLEDFTALRSFF